MSAFAIALTGLLFHGSMAVPNAAESGAPNAAERGVVRIVDHSPRGGGMGTGVIVGRNETGILALTALHVVDPGERLELQFFADSRVVATTFAVEILQRSAEADLAVIHATTRFDPGAAVEVSHSPHDLRSAKVVSIGCSLGAAPTPRSELCKGPLLLDRPQRRALFLVTDGPAIRGRSGGPLLDDEGRLIGICRGGLDATREQPSEGLYASPVEIRQILDSIRLPQSKSLIAAQMPR